MPNIDVSQNGTVKYLDSSASLFEIGEEDIPDSRVVRLVKRMGSIRNTNQRRALCMDKVDLVAKKSGLLKVVDEFKDLLGCEKHLMISGLKGTGVKQLTLYLMEKAVKRP